MQNLQDADGDVGTGVNEANDPRVLVAERFVSRDIAEGSGVGNAERLRETNICAV